MTKSTSTKSLADSTMAMLGQAMDRNSRLAEAPHPPAKAPAVPTPAAATIPPPPSPPIARPRPAAPTRPLRTSGLRFTAQDHERINRIINQALSLGHRIPMSDAVRLALIGYNPKSLTTADLASLQATDGRLRRRANRESW
jgi:hypothetical protein